MPPDPLNTGPPPVITAEAPYVRWSVPVAVREALTVLTQQEWLYGVLRSYVSGTLRRKWPDMGSVRIDDLFAEAVAKLLGKSDLQSRFGVLVGARREQPLAPYVLRTAIHLEWDQRRRLQREQRLEAKRQRERAERKRFELSDEEREQLEILAQKARGLVERRHWNELLQKIDPRWHLTGPAFQPWPDIERAASLATRRSDVHRARAVLRPLLRDSDLERAIRILLCKIFFRRCKP